MEIDGETEQSGVESPKNSTDKAESTSGKRQMKKNDSGICEEKSESSCDESFKRKKMNGAEPRKGDGDSVYLPENLNVSSQSPAGKGDGFSKVKSKFKNRNYRNRSQIESLLDKDSSEDEEQNALKKKTKSKNANMCSPDSGIPEASSSNGAVDEDEATNADEPLSWEPDLDSSNQEEIVKKDDEISLSSSSNSSSCSDSSTSLMEDSKFDVMDSDKEDPPSVLLKQKPKHKWFVTPEIVNRQLGCSNKKKGPELFQQRMYGSLHSVQRLELMYKLEFHSGCVNSLNFNQSGTWLASGSDDLQICLWNWPLGKLLSSFNTGHKSNVFQAKFLPLLDDTCVVSCARDGQVRLAALGSDGHLLATKKIAQHRGPAHKLAIQSETPHIFLSCGEDGRVMSLDVRQSEPAMVLLVKENTRKICLYSIHSNPLNNHEFVVCGRDSFIRIYDQRNTSIPKRRFCPQHLNEKEPFPHVTCAVFNYNGTEVVASYNDEDIYLFDTRHSDGCDFVHRYRGHRNSATVKGVNFFGPKSEFIVSGSDCGNIFFWEKETEAIVQWMAGDENGVVNCLEPHPDIPILATSGLDKDVKIWVPSCEQEPTLEGLKKTVMTNLKARHEDSVVGGGCSPETIDEQIFRMLWPHIRPTERLILQSESFRSRGENNEDGNSSVESLTYSDEEEGQDGLQ